MLNLEKYVKHLKSNIYTGIICRITCIFVATTLFKKPTKVISALKKKIPKTQEALRSPVCEAEGAGRGHGSSAAATLPALGLAAVSQHQGQGQVHGRHSTLTEQILTVRSLLHFLFNKLRLLKGQCCGQEH